MAFIIKTLLGVLGVSISVCSIAYPLTMSNGSSTSRRIKRSGGGHSEQKVSLIKCSTGVNQEGAEISFGDNQVVPVCYIGKEGLPVETRLASLFIDRWNKEDGSGSGSSGSLGRSSCVDKKGLIDQTSVKGEILGLCDSSSEPKYFLYVEKEDKKVKRVLVCEGDCFESMKDSNGFTNYLSRKQQNGKEIKFQKMN